MMPLFQLKNNDLKFPPAHFADSEGMIAVGGDLSPDRVLEAYRNGIYFWFGPMDPIKWWSPDPRLILKPNELKNRYAGSFPDLSIRPLDDPLPLLRNLQNQENKGEMGPHWVTEEMIDLYTALIHRGFVRTWDVYDSNSYQAGILGIHIGKILFLEYIHTRSALDITATSEKAVAALARELDDDTVEIIDIQKETIRIPDMGIIEMSRLEYLDKVQDAVNQIDDSINP